MDATLSDPLVGCLLDSRYRVESRLARGGMATVYLALDERLDRMVALKVMHPGLADDDEFVSRFIREARSTARLSHPNVVAVFDQGADDGHVYLAMEYVEGRTLRDLLDDRGPLTPREAFSVLEPVLAALGAAHYAGIVHRDVKPENVLLADDGRIKVADFGLARVVSSVSSVTRGTGVLIGTVSYLSPEQVVRGVADARSDVYAGGILLFEMLTGAPPHAGETPLAVAYQHVHSDVPAPSSRVGGLPAAVDALVDHATRRDPDQRPADAGAFHAEVVRARANLPAEELDAGGSGALVPPTESPVRNTLVVPVGGESEVADTDGEDTLGEDTGDTSATPTRSRRVRRSVRDRRPGRLALVGVLVLALLVGLAAWWLGSGRYTDTPDVLQRTKAVAVERLLAADLEVHLGKPAFSETVPPGRVVATDPGPGERVVRGDEVTLVLSKGKERYDVPEIEGKKLGAAERLLERTNLTVGGTTLEWSSEVSKDHVISATPKPGTEVRRDTPIRLVISRGPEPVQLPDLRNLAKDDAVARLAALGMEAKVTEQYSDSVAAGLVAGHRPAPGRTIGKGSTVTLVVSRGPQLFAVPDVTGQHVDAAQQTLESAGFAVDVQSWPGGPGNVLRQSPGAGEEHPHGTTITLYVF
ncbi:MAG: Stk1 family PASTA domain-containing Ser/Thr kinase [Actinomycetes bacterium]